MNNSKDSVHKPTKDANDAFLDLPNALDYISTPPNLSVEENIKLCEKMLPFWNKKRFEDQSYFDDQVLEPFYL